MLRRSFRIITKIIHIKIIVKDMNENILVCRMHLYIYILLERKPFSELFIRNT